MLKQLKKREQGFTIIEVMIVLAIAGLIMLIVFLAVPALQRTSRNTQRKNDVSALLAEYTDYVNNNGGVLPTANTWITGVKLGYYTSSNITYTYHASAGAAMGAITNADNVTISNYEKCNTSTPGAAVAGTQRQVVALYAVETQGSPTPICQES